MSPGRPSRDAARLRHALLLDIAIDHFLAHGMEASSIESIAKDAGVSKATIYRRYKDRTDLFKAAATRFAEAHIRSLAYLDTDDRPVPVVLEEVARGFIDDMYPDADDRRNFREFSRVMWTQQPLCPELPMHCVRLFRVRVSIPLASYLTRQANKGLLKVDDAESASWHLFHMASSLTMVLATDIRPDAAHRDRIVRSAVSIFLDGTRVHKS